MNEWPHCPNHRRRIPAVIYASYVHGLTVMVWHCYVCGWSRPLSDDELRDHFLARPSVRQA